MTKIRRGFTLVELLVVIAIVMALAAITFSVAKKVMEKAKLVTLVNGLKQCGAAVLADSMDTGQIYIFRGGNGAGDRALAAMVASQLGSDVNDFENREAVFDSIKGVVYTPAMVPDKYSVWTTYGVNVDSNEEMGVVTNTVKVENDDGSTARIQAIRPGLAHGAGSYPLIADSSNASGQPRLRFGNDDDYKFALRYNEKGAAAFLDGSCRMVTESDLLKYGITHAYLFENGPKAEPVLITAE